MDEDDEGIITSSKVTSSGCHDGPRTTKLGTPTFSSIIEADHFTIQRLAAKFRNPQTPAKAKKEILLDITWHLIRHDVSEELVMRPSFEVFLGSQGREMAENDRADHYRAKQQLLSLLRYDLEKPGALTEKAHEEINRLFDELAEHMAMESGQMIPQFEKMLSEEASRELASKYARTLVLTPEVTILRREDDDYSRKQCFKGLEEYTAASSEDFRNIMHHLEQEATVDSAYIDKMIRLESEKLEIGKWKPFNQKKPGTVLGKL